MKHYRAVVSEALESKSEDFVGLRHRAKALQDSMKHAEGHWFWRKKTKHSVSLNAFCLIFHQVLPLIGVALDLYTAYDNGNNATNHA